MRKMSLSMRRLSVAPCGAVPWVPSNEVQRGNGIGETPEEGGKLYFSCFFVFSLLFPALLYFCSIFELVFSLYLVLFILYIKKIKILPIFV